MTLTSWLSNWPNRRHSLRRMGAAEILESRALLVGTMPQQLAEAIDDHDSPIQNFASREDFGEYLVERALARYEHWFGAPAWYYHGPVFYSGDGFSAELSASALDVVQRDHSETNTQVDGVDEGDIIETDGTYLYILSGGGLRIVQAYPAEEMIEVARIGFAGYPIAEYLDGDRLTVISSQSSFSFGDARLASLIWPGPTSHQTVISVFDVSDPSAPALEKEATLDGYYVDSRYFDGQVHVLTSNDVALPAPEIAGTTTIEVPIFFYTSPPVLFDGDVVITSIEPTDELFDGGKYEETTQTIEVPVYESLESYLERVRSELDILIDDVIPQYRIVTANGLGAIGAISEVAAISMIPDGESDSLLSVVSFDVRDPQPGLISSSSVFVDYTNGIYANREHLYVFSPVWESDGAHTRILEFAWANGDREIELIGTGLVEGSLLNQFSADEYDGRLRIATTTFDFLDGQFVQANNLTILENIDGELVPVGAVEDFAPGERIYSVRFQDEQAFVVTFRQVDPLFVFDLSEPTNPVITGELHVPGFSSYLQLIDDSHLLAIGRSTDTFATKVTLYDISDPTNPTEIDEDILPSWTWSQAEWDHLAVGWYGAHQTLAIPVSGFSVGSGFRQELLVFRIDVNQTGESAIQQIGAVADDAYIQRSVYIENVLYSVSENSVIAVDILNPREVLGELNFEFDPEFMTLFDLELLYLEYDDGAMDWEYLNLGDGAGTDSLLALAAVNLIDGRVRISLLDCGRSVTGTLRNDELILRSRGHRTETIPLGDVAGVLLEGTSGSDRVTLALGASTKIRLDQFVVNLGEGHDRLEISSWNPALAESVVIRGEAGNDRFIVSSSVRASMQLMGGDGKDTLQGGRGDDTLDGGAGNDSLDGRGGNDLLLGGDDADTLNGGDGNDTLSGGAGRDRLNGNRGDDAMAGGDDADWLSGGTGHDTLLGGHGNDSLRGGDGDDICLGEDGDDHVNGEQSQRDTVSGGSGRNRVIDRASEIFDEFVFTADWLDLV